MLLFVDGDFFRGVLMGVGARVGAPAHQARSSVFWLSFERARAAGCRHSYASVDFEKQSSSGYSTGYRGLYPCRCGTFVAYASVQLGDSGTLPC